MRPRRTVAPDSSAISAAAWSSTSGSAVAVHAPLEAVRGLAVQLVPARHPPDGARIPVRGLEQDAGRLVAHLGVRAAHRAGQRLRAARVLDDQVVGDRASAACRRAW